MNWKEELIAKILKKTPNSPEYDEFRRILNTEFIEFKGDPFKFEEINNLRYNSLIGVIYLDYYREGTQYKVEYYTRNGMLGNQSDYLKLLQAERESAEATV